MRWLFAWIVFERPAHQPYAETSDNNNGGVGVTSNNDNSDDITKVYDHAREKAREVQSKEERAMLGLSEDGPVLAGGVRSKYGDLGNEGAGSKSSKRHKRATDKLIQDILLHNLLDQLHTEIADTQQRIAVIEERLVTEFGENFLELNAQKYLLDDMPERPSDMLDEAWQALLEDRLATKMLNADGSIKPEYTHLDIARWLSENRRLDELEVQADRVLEGAEELARGGLTAEEESKLKNDLSTETLGVLNKAELNNENDTLRKPFQNAVTGATEVDGKDASSALEGQEVLANFGVEIPKV